MAKGTFRKIQLETGIDKLSKVRHAFGSQASKMAKQVLEEIAKEAGLTGDMLEYFLRHPGDAWLVTIRHVYRAFMNVLKSKLLEGTLTYDPKTGFNVTIDEVKALLPADFKEKVKAHVPVKK